jgi:hypothetical protein
MGNVEGPIMSHRREIERRQAEIGGLKAILQNMPDDPLAKPLLVSRLKGMEADLATLEKQPPARPEAESETIRLRGVWFVVEFFLIRADSTSTRTTRHPSPEFLPIPSRRKPPRRC